MLKYLVQLPCEVFGHNMLGFLELADIIRLENAATSHKSQQLLISILPYCPPVAISDCFNHYFVWNREVINWFKKRHCSIQLIKIPIESLSKVDFEYSTLENIELYLKRNISLNDTKLLENSCFKPKICRVKMNGYQDPAVMEVLFSLLSNSSSVRSVDIESSNLFEWMENIKKIGPYLQDLALCSSSTQLSIITTITGYCPYLEKLSLKFQSSVIDNNALQSVANNCPHLRSLEIDGFNYNTSAECDADLTAFAEKCPQLEELSLTCPQLTDQSVIALAQHCSRLKKLKLDGCDLAATSLIALSERGLPLEELDIPRIPIFSAEIAAQCAHALSQIRELRARRVFVLLTNVPYPLQYMTGLRKL